MYNLWGFVATSFGFSPLKSTEDEFDSVFVLEILLLEIGNVSVLRV
jgi:hypothetical protein